MALDPTAEISIINDLLQSFSSQTESIVRTSIGQCKVWLGEHLLALRENLILNDHCVSLLF